jgi:hypothetical protein
MIVAVHQPNFLPWMGFFYKMAKVDQFVFSDTHILGDRTYTTRVKIKTATGPQWLTLPVLTKGLHGQTIAEALCPDDVSWRRKIPRTLEINYGGCPHYRPHGDEICHIIATSSNRLEDLNISLLEYIARQLGIKTPRVLASRMRFSADDPTEYLVSCCKALGADRYLSGIGGARRVDAAAFQAAGIDFSCSDFQHPRYPQPFGEFVPGLSIVDLLFNVGPDSRRFLGV